MIFYVLLSIVLLVILLYLLAIMPKIYNKPDLTPFMGRYYAHRGLHQSKKTSPENSIAAFKLAVDNNYGIELDVQLTKDHVPVVFHDYNLLRTCGVDKKVRDLTFKELQEYNLYKSTQKIPTLKSVLELVDGKVPLIIEYKVEARDTSVCPISNDLLKNYNGTYCIESFNPFVLLWYKKYYPNVMRGQLSSNFLKDKEDGNKVLYFMLQNLLLNFLTKPHFIAYSHTHHNMLSLRICRKLYKTTTFAWTLNSNEELEYSRKHFDFFIFDRFIPTK